MMLTGHGETQGLCVYHLSLSLCVCVCDLLMLLVPEACVSEVMDELLCASLFPIIGFSSVCVCVNCLPYRSCFHWNDDLIVESGAVQLFESHLYIQLCLYKSLWLIGYQTENQSVASSEQLTGLGLLTCGRELCFCLHGSSFVHFVSGVRLWSTAEDSESAVAISWSRKATWGQTVRE